MGHCRKAGSEGVQVRGAAHRYVFVAGLHRTGTSLLARAIASHPAVAAIEGAPIPENEGAYLQGAIPHTAQAGIPGEYAADPAQHLTEADPRNTLETKLRLEHEWGEWFDPAKPWRLEKSPVNLTRTRLLQALFPLAQFVIVTRHPAFMAEALRKWSDKRADELARYGAHAYAIMLADLAYLHAAMVVRYEDLVARPASVLAGIAAFLDLRDECVCEPLRDGNADYRAGGGGAVAELGYGEGGAVHPVEPIVRHPLRSIRERTHALLGPGRR
jgi:hypothetical protein